MHTAEALLVASAAAVPPFSPEPGLRRRILASSPKLMIVHHEMDQGWAGARHSHPHEQVVYVVSGHLRVSRGDETFEVGVGGSFVVFGGVEHQAWALELSVVLDLFTLAREDYLLG